VATTVRVYVPAGVVVETTGDGCLPPQPTSNSRATSTAVVTQSRSLLRPLAPMTSTPKSPNGTDSQKAKTLPCAADTPRAWEAEPDVVTVTVTEDGLLPGVTERGLTVQVVVEGAPLHASVTVLEKAPPVGLMLSS
jgi:hypothetical protein